MQYFCASNVAPDRHHSGRLQRSSFVLVVFLHLVPVFPLVSPLFFVSLLSLVSPPFFLLHLIPLISLLSQILSLP